MARQVRGRKARQKGFSLIEIMVVVVIIGILAALIVPRLMDRPDQARVVAARQDIAALMQALKLFKLDNGRYPSAEQGLQALVKPRRAVARCRSRPIWIACPMTRGAIRTSIRYLAPTATSMCSR